MLVEALPTPANLEQYRERHARCVTLLRDMLLYKGQHVRPIAGRRASPFVQTKCPEIARDKLSDEPGQILSKAEFMRRARTRTSPFVTADIEASLGLDPDLISAIDHVRLRTRRKHRR